VIDRLEKLADAGIEMVPVEMASHFILARDGFVAFVERRDNDFGNIGAPGLMTERGYAALIWRDGSAFFVGKGIELPASPEQIKLLRDFTTDLTAALTHS
jgi:hypothetical protein